jgi:hypothetical protein
MIGWTAEIVAGGVGFLIANWFVNHWGITALWLTAVIDVVGVCAGGIIVGFTLLGWGSVFRRSGNCKNRGST